MVLPEVRSRAGFLISIKYQLEFKKWWRKTVSVWEKAAPGCMSHVNCHNRPIISVSLPLSHTHAQDFCFSLPELAQDIFFLRNAQNSRRRKIVSKLLSVETFPSSLLHDGTEMCCQCVAAVKHPDCSHTAALPGPASFRSLALSPHSFLFHLHLRL